jgi:hypothetical protein
MVAVARRSSERYPREPSGLPEAEGVYFRFPAIKVLCEATYTHHGDGRPVDDWTTDDRGDRTKRQGARGPRWAVNLIHFEAADSDERTQIGEALVKFARKRNRLDVGRAEGRYFLNHEDGCDAGGEPIREGDSFYLDPDTGEVLCEDHGREREGREE